MADNTVVLHRVRIINGKGEAVDSYTSGSKDAACRFARGVGVGLSFSSRNLRVEVKNLDTGEDVNFLLP